MERYHFFGSSIRSWQPTAEGLLEGRTDEGEATGMLATCLRVLTEVHAEFFAGTGAEDSVAAPAPAASASGASGGAEGGALKASTKRRRVRGGGAGGNGDGRSGSEGPGGGAAGAAAGASAARLVDPSALRGRDVRTCLADARARVLRGACVCFSRCWPQSFSAFDQPLWVLAESLGADCSTHYVPGRTTHVVAAPDRTGELPLTDKVGRAFAGDVVQLRARTSACSGRGAGAQARAPLRRSAAACGPQLCVESRPERLWRALRARRRCRPRGGTACTWCTTTGWWRQSSGGALTLRALTTLGRPCCHVRLFRDSSAGSQKLGGTPARRRAWRARRAERSSSLPWRGYPQRRAARIRAFPPLPVPNPPRWKRTDEAVYEMPAYSQSGRAAGAKARGFSWQPAAAESDAAIARRAAGRAGG